mgnify:CR=1 FL=1
MDHGSPLTGTKDVLVDANILIAIGDPSNAKFRQFRRAVQTAGVVLKLPQRVVGEIGGRDTDRVQTALDEGWAEIIESPDPTDGDAVAASDIAKRTIANTTGQPEHEVEKADAILAGLAIQYLKDHATAGVVVLTDDKPARNGIETAVTTQGYTETIGVYGLVDIIGDESGDSVRLI